MELDTIQLISIILGSNVANSIITMFLSRRKNKAEVDKTNAEVDSTQLDNLTKQLDFYQKLVTSYKGELEDYIELMEETRLEVLRLRKVIGRIINDVCLAQNCTKRMYLKDAEVEQILEGKRNARTKNNDKEDIQQQ